MSTEFLEQQLLNANCQLLERVIEHIHAGRFANAVKILKAMKESFERTADIKEQINAKS